MKSIRNTLREEKAYDYVLITSQDLQKNNHLTFINQNMKIK